MKSINSNIKFLYILLICSSFINILGVLNIIPMIKILNLIIWFIIFIIGIFITRSDYNHFYNIKDKVGTILILLLIYFMLYFSLGLIFGYSYNVYDNSNYIGVLKNISIYIIPLIFQEYIRGILCNYSNKNKYLIIFISILFILVNFNYNSLSSIFISGESFFRFLCVNVMPLICVEFVMTYLCLVGSFKLSLIYKVLIGLYSILLPILPNLNFFIDGFIKICFPIIIYLMIDNSYQKELKHQYIEYKKNNILEYIPVVIIIGVIICNYIGIFKYQIISIMSDSMNPLYYRGDAVVLKELNNKEKEKLKIGDIIGYYDKDGNLIVHRIKSINTENDDIRFITKGDNNEDVDNKSVELKDIKGKYLLHIKFIGYPKYVIYETLSR